MICGRCGEETARGELVTSWCERCAKIEPWPVLSASEIELARLRGYEKGAEAVMRRLRHAQEVMATAAQELDDALHDRGAFQGLDALREVADDAVQALRAELEQA